MPRVSPVSKSSSRPPLHEAGLGFRVWRSEQSSAMPAPHTHPDVELNFLHVGRLRYLHGSRMVEIPAGRLAVLWGGMPHQTLPPPERLTGVWITLPIATVLGWNLPGQCAARLLGGEVLVSPESDRASAGDAERVEQWVEDFGGSAESRATLLLELEARLRRLAAAVAEPGSVAGGRALHLGGGAGHVARVAAYLARHYNTSPLAVAQVASAVRLHPNYLMRLFRRQARMTLWEYVTRLRLADVHRRLLTSDSRVLDAALAAGFGSAASFYAARARYGGIPPRRRAARPG